MYHAGTNGFLIPRLNKDRIIREKGRLPRRLNASAQTIEILHILEADEHAEEVDGLAAQLEAWQQLDELADWLQAWDEEDSRQEQQAVEMMIEEFDFQEWRCCWKPTDEDVGAIASRLPQENLLDDVILYEIFSLSIDCNVILYEIFSLSKHCL